MEVHSDGRTIAAVGFGHIHSVHPYSVSLVQSETEAILAARLAQLGVTIERSSTLTSYASGQNHIDAAIVGPGGNTRTVRAQFLVGADGARSTVRHLMGQELGGSFAGGDVLLGDVDADHDYERSHFHAFFSPGRQPRCCSRCAATGCASSRNCPLASTPPASYGRLAAERRR